MERVIIGSLSIEKASGTTSGKLSRFWLLNLCVGGLGGVLSVAAALIISLLAAIGAVDQRKSTGLIVTGLLVAGLSALLWAAHAMDRLAALRIEGGREAGGPSL
jgi:hypothetical protein